MRNWIKIWLMTVRTFWSYTQLWANGKLEAGGKGAGSLSPPLTSSLCPRKHSCFFHPSFMTPPCTVASPVLIKRLFFISLYMGVHLTFDSPEASPSGPPERLTLCRSLPVSLCRIHLSICTIKSLRGRITSVYPIQFYFHNLGIIGTQEIFVVE